MPGTNNRLLATFGSYSPITFGLGNRVTINVFDPLPLRLELTSGEEDKLDFGCQTLAATRLAALLLHHEPFQTRGIAGEVVGLSTLRSQPFYARGTVVSATARGYVRCLSIRTDDGAVLTVGGNNATAEDVAARMITFYLPRRALERSDLAPFQHYDRRLAPSRSEGVLKYLYILRRHTDAIYAARAARTAASARLLSHYLTGLADPQSLEVVCEGFRDFSCLFSQSSELAQSVAIELYNFIRNKLYSDSHGNAVVYAVESLGYIAKFGFHIYEMIMEMLRTLLFQIRGGSVHPDLLWSLVVAMGARAIRKLDLTDSIEAAHFSAIRGAPQIRAIITAAEALRL